MKSRIISLFVMVAFVLTLGLGTSFGQDTTKVKSKSKAKVVKTVKIPKSHKKAAKKDSTAKI
jgi:hypothetical protein